MEGYNGILHSVKTVRGKHIITLVHHDLMSDVKRTKHSIYSFDNAFSPENLNTLIGWMVYGSIHNDGEIDTFHVMTD